MESTKLSLAESEESDEVKSTLVNHFNQNKVEVQTIKLTNFFRYFNVIIIRFWFNFYHLSFNINVIYTYLKNALSITAFLFVCSFVFI